MNERTSQHPEQSRSTIRVGIRGAILTIIAIPVSGPIGLAVVEAIGPSPPWNGPELYARSYHPIQTLPFFAAFGGLVPSRGHTAPINNGTMTDRLVDELLEIVETMTPRLRAIEAKQAAEKPRPTTWSIKEILGHLVDSASNNHQRFVRTQCEAGYSGPKYEQDQWVSSQAYNESPWHELIDLWRLYNRHLAQVIRRISKEKLDVTCRIGPYEPVTLAFLVEDYVAHIRHHLEQIAGKVSS